MKRVTTKREKRNKPELLGEWRCEVRTSHADVRGPLCTGSARAAGCAAEEQAAHPSDQGSSPLQVTLCCPSTRNLERASYREKPSPAGRARAMPFADFTEEADIPGNQLTKDCL